MTTNPAQPNQTETDEQGWLIERGGLCLGTECRKPAWVTFTNPSAIRFAREEDGLRMLESLKSFGKDSGSFHDCIVSGHQWMLAKPSDSPTTPLICKWCGADIVQIGDRWAHSDCKPRLTHHANPIIPAAPLKTATLDLPIYCCPNCARITELKDTTCKCGHPETDHVLTALRRYCTRCACKTEKCLCVPCGLNDDCPMHGGNRLMAADPPTFAYSPDTPEWPPVGMCCVIYPFDMGERLICQRGVNHSGAHKAVGMHAEYSWPSQPAAPPADTEIPKNYLLIVLGEEGGEVVQAAAKCQRFGWSRNQPGYGINHEVLAKEVGDLMGIVDALGLDVDLIAASRASKMDRVRRTLKEIGSSEPGK